MPTIIALAACAGAAFAQESLAPVSGEPWVLKFEPAAWYAAPNGNIRLPGSASAGNGETFEAKDLNLDSPKTSPFGELHLRRGDWQISVRATGFNADGRGTVATGGGQIGDVVFAAGDTLRSSMDVTAFSLGAGYAIHKYEGRVPDSDGLPVRSTIHAIVGIRAVDAEISTSLVPVGSSGATAGTSGDALHAHPYAGVRWELELFEDFTIDLTGSLGGLSTGDSESWSSDILVGFQWNPTPYVGAQIGYRQLLMGVEDGEAPTEFAWQGGLAGVYAGLTLRF